MSIELLSAFYKSVIKQSSLNHYFAYAASDFTDEYESCLGGSRQMVCIFSSGLLTYLSCKYQLLYSPLHLSYSNKKIWLILEYRLLFTNWNKILYFWYLTHHSIPKCMYTPVSIKHELLLWRCLHRNTWRIHHPHIAVQLEHHRTMSHVSDWKGQDWSDYSL